MIEGIRHNGFGLGFVEGPWVPRDVQSTVVGRDRLVVVVGPDHLWARRRGPIGGAELAATPLVLRERGSGTCATLEAALKTYGSVAIPFWSWGRPHRCAAASGLGPAVPSAMAVQEDLREERLVAVTTDPSLQLERFCEPYGCAGRNCRSRHRSCSHWFAAAPAVRATASGSRRTAAERTCADLKELTLHWPAVHIISV
ncbi:LysR substrate-binding domain-containing protein [Streptomyces sp. NBC_00873]|uniref:LysR substrate-binding domain-containing protein n=1 Tax=unclassified Streptomyces TaxID=2593676 RepID=UPI003868282D|nr:LysR substrate-binding domain-containing protein [Streptomyces sp. NBC_00873]WTA48142.1 LysR substrate-binding domain-containing protein [Streptomyces sp. NBC_00842]